MAFDLERFECAYDLARGVSPQPSCAAFPTESDVQVQRENNFPTAGCVHDPLDPQVIDCLEAPFALSNSTVRVGNFAGTMRLRKTGDTTSTLYLSVRGDPSVTWIDVDTSTLMNVAQKLRWKMRLGISFIRSTAPLNQR